MKKLAAINFLLWYAVNSFAQSKVLDGIYHTGLDLKLDKMQNVSGGNTFRNITVNGDTLRNIPKTMQYTIALSKMNIADGSIFHVAIFSISSTAPVFVNYKDFATETTTSFRNQIIDSQKKFNFELDCDGKVATLIIQQFRWNRWVPVGTLETKGAQGFSAYSFDLEKYITSGKNQFRVEVNSFAETPLYSKPSDVEDPTIAPVELNTISVRKNMPLEFSAVTLYEIFDENGTCMLNGYAKTVDVKMLVKGSYFVNYGNFTAEFRKE
ncbi:MAG: hypothetical protein HY064_13055 [Bacteroidetes bacterium]|nr:hypothetical protein [Bacteroidota bacterium]